MSFYAFEELFMLLFAAGVDVGDVGHSRMTAREMNEAVAGFGRGQLKAFLELVSPITGHLPHLGVAADKLTDLGGKQSQMAIFRVNNKKSPLTVFADVNMLNLEYDQGHEVSSHACFNELAEDAESFGVNLFEIL